jgi:hypothetical protein
MTVSDIDAQRQAWLKMLHLCLTELGVEPLTIVYLTAMAERADARRQMVVHRVVGHMTHLDLYNEDRSLCVTAPVHGADMPSFLGRSITYIPDGPTHGVFVDEIVDRDL